jgi:hypothetical protein
MLRYAVTIFLSAFLLFQVQPLLGRYVLPWFGGTPAVWTTCLLFFQLFLLAGYAYAHAVIAWLRPNVGARLHVALLIASVLVLPIIPDEAWRPRGEEAPTWHILSLLAVTIGAPYLALSATGPLVQAWFGQAFRDRSPYRLYALSNAGSLLALITYPLLVEPTLRLGTQALIWSGAYAVFVACCVACAWPIRGLKGRGRRSSSQTAVEATRPAPATIGFWSLLAMTASVMLLATTNQMCQEVAVVPLLWILPLALYLLTFILCFDSQQWYSRGAFAAVLTVFGPLACIVYQLPEAIPLWLQIVVYCATLFACGMICHGELARQKPDPRYLTLFYLSIATGGALGGIFVAVVAPCLFYGYWEYHLALGACFVLLLTVHRRDQLAMARQRTAWRQWLRPAGIFAVLVAALGMQAGRESSHTIAQKRNFYGVLRVVEKPAASGGATRMLIHGRIQHGSQFAAERRRNWPTNYYGRTSGAGLALTEHPRRDDPADSRLRVGLIGLGVGTLAAYGKAGDWFRYYEINPQVSDYASRYFTFLRDSPANIEVVHGDGRVRLERDLAERGPLELDVLVVDAFSSDAIPRHLLTTECAELYWKHLKHDGILAINISNRYLDLKPVVQGLALHSGKRAVWVRSHEERELGTSDADWVLMTSNLGFLNKPGIKNRVKSWPSDRRVVWTDDFGGIAHVLAH